MKLESGAFYGGSERGSNVILINNADSNNVSYQIFDMRRGLQREYYTHHRMEIDLWAAHYDVVRHFPTFIGFMPEEE